MSAPIAPTELVRPPRLRQGDTVAVISPGRWMAADELATSAARLEAMGVKVFLHPQNYLRRHQFAGSSEERLKAFHDVFEDGDVRAVMLAKSGYGSLHLLDSIDYDLVANHPKILVGYSDATALLMALRKRAGVISFHGPMLFDLRERVDARTWQCFGDVLMHGQTLRLDSSTDSQVEVLRAGSGAGPLAGGNLTLLTNLIGTATDFDTEGQILFLEDCDEKLYAVDRLLLHLKRAGKLERLAGLMMGDMARIRDDEVPFGQSVDELVLMHCAGSDFPIVTRCPFGHGVHQLILPVGVPSAIHADEKGFRFELLEPAVT